jgi:curved DNA-binding protein CbpA
VSLYDVLGVGKDADQASIKRAHRKAAKSHHPDKGGSREDFERVQHAYLVLSSTDRRSRYDETGEHEDQIDNLLSELTELIIPAFDHVFEQAGEDFEHRDLITDTCLLMTERKAIMAVEKKKTEAKIKRVKKLLKRIKFDNDGTDIIGNVYKERIEKLELEVLEFEKVVARLGAAVEYLKHYGFEFTEQEQPTIRTFTWVKMS